MTEIITLPELHLADWRATKDTLHLYCQIVGKIRLATTAPRNHWWNVPLYVDIRGISTRRLHHGDTTFEITIDCVDHALVVRTADGQTKSFELGGGVPVADFDARVHAILGELGVDVKIKEEPFGVPMTTPFALDSKHGSWDREAITRLWRILDWSDSVFEEFSGWFNGKISPVHLFWHSFDLAVTRFSGRPAPPVEADRVTREAYTHEVISFGFWPPGARRAARAATGRGRMDRVGLRLAGDPSLSDGTHRARPQNHPARVLPKRLRGRRPPRRLGYVELRVHLVPHPGPTPATPRHRRSRPRPSKRAPLMACRTRTGVGTKNSRGPAEGLASPSRWVPGRP